MLVIKTPPPPILLSINLGVSTQGLLHIIISCVEMENSPTFEELTKDILYS
jgi:CDP-diacylglycerol pyrophosphatase